MNKSDLDLQDVQRSRDPIFLEVFWTRMRSIVDEAAKLIVRTSFSTLSTEAKSKLIRYSPPTRRRPTVSFKG